jgi:protease-4
MKLHDRALRFLLAAAAVTLGGAHPAWSQELFEAPAPTRGVLVPGGAIAGDANATALETNPGQLGLLDTTSTALVVNVWPGGTVREGRGGGFFYAAPLILRSLSIGAAVEWLRPSLESQPSNYGKLALGAGFRLARGLGFGLVWERLFLDRFAGTSSLGLGLGWRPRSWLAAGVTVRDLFRPRAETGGPRLPRETDIEVALRPTGTPRLEIAAGLRSLQGLARGADSETRFSPHVRFSLGLLPALALFGEWGSPRAEVLSFAADGTAQGLTAYQGVLGLTASLDRLMVGAAAIASGEPGVDGASSPRGAGASLVLHSSFNRKPALISFPHLARVKLRGLEGDRAFVETLVALSRLGDDPAVGGLLLQVERLDLGYGRIAELRAVLSEINRSKPVFFSLSQPSTGEYYLASAGRAIVMHPAGDLFLGGLASTVTFFKNALDQLGVAVELVRIAEYKGAMEPFVLSSQSEPVRENRNALLDDLYGRLLDEISRSRSRKGIDRARIAALFDQGLFSAVEAKDLGLIDEVGDERQLEKILERQMGRKLELRDADFGRRDTGRWQSRRVAIILVDGAITDGRPQGLPSPVQGAVAWADPILDAMAAVRRDPSVGAVVLRVNSPGGSAFASDRIAREVARLREARKPVVVSMGDTAASGGYYVAAPADTIVASPSVVTGSIGIYAFKLDLGALVGKLGITTETTTRGGRADFYSMYRPWREDEKVAVNARIRSHYQQFLKTVAGGRKQQGIDERRADDLGRGQVYTGAQAQKLGLVDQLGGVTTAINEAARRGRVATGPGGMPELVLLPAVARDPLEMLLALRRLVEVDDRSGEESAPAPTLAPSAVSAAAAFLARHGRAAARLLLPLVLADPASDPIQARLPYDLEVR